MIRKTLLAATAILPLVLGMTPAHADPDDGLPVSDAVVVEGSGTIDPGLPCASNCTVKLHFTAVFAGDDAVTTTECDFSGTGGADTLLAGAGGGTITCDDGSSGKVTFSRTLAAVTVGGTVSVGGACHTITAALVFVPEDVNPTTKFLLAGAGVLADAAATLCA